MKKEIIIIISLVICSSIYSQDFAIEKVSDIYKAELYVRMTKNDDYIFASGQRALHVLDCDQNGNLRQINELPLWGNLKHSEIVVINDYVYIYGYRVISDANWPGRVYKIKFENEDLVLEDSLNYYDEGIDKILGIGENLFLLTYYIPQKLYIFDNENFQVIAEYDIEPNFSDNDIYKINDQFIYTWDNQIDRLMHIYDVSDVFNIQEIGTIDFSDEFTDIPIDESVLINENTLVICHPELFSFFDISEITSWQLITTVDFSLDPALNNLAVLNGERIIIPTISNKAKLFDISNIQEPLFISLCEYQRFDNVPYCVCKDNNFYIAGWGLGIDQCRVNNDQIEYIGKFPKFSSRRHSYKYNDLFAVRTKYYRGMHFFDLSDLNNINFICSQFNNYYVYGIDFEDNYLAVPLTSYPDNVSNIDIYDISDIEYPILVNRIENIFSTNVYLEYPYLYSRETILERDEHPYLYDVDYFGESIYNDKRENNMCESESDINLLNNDNYLDRYDYHFVKYDISAPFIPQIIYDFELSPHMYGYFKYDDFIYYRGGDETVNILGNLDSEYPEVVGSMTIDGLIAFWPRNDGYFQAQYNVLDDSYYSMYSLQNPLEPEFLFEYPYRLESFSVGIKDNIFFQGSFSIFVYDIENGYDYYNPIYDFETPYFADVRYFFEEDEEKYILFNSETGISLYRYEYDHSNVSGNDIILKNFRMTNHPNPVSNQTSISFHLTNSRLDNAEISIYNIKGQRVKQFPVIGNQNSITWNATDEFGKRVSNGVYFYKLNVNNKNKAVRKMIVIRH